MNAALRQDLRDAAKIQRKRAVEEERKLRILNPRQRLFGVDVNAWKKQTQEKEMAKQEEELLNENYEKQKLREDLICVAQDLRIAEERKDILRKIEDFRKNFQRYEDRREFDLNDPLFLKKSLPARIYDDDPRCSISSAQKFDGEDVERDERLKLQGEQTRAWLEQQIAEKRQNQYDKQKAEETYQQALIARDKRAIELTNLERDCIKKLNKTTAQFNRTLAEEREFKMKEGRTKEELDKAAEKHNWMTSDLLTENPEVAASNLGPSRVIGYMYKGEPLERAYDTRHFQIKQIEEKKIRRQQEEAIDQEWCSLKEKLRRKVYLQDKELMAQQRELNKKMVDMNMRLAQEKRERDEFYNKVVYTNTPTEAYYDQFNRSLS